MSGRLLAGWAGFLTAVLLAGLTAVPAGAMPMASQGAGPAGGALARSAGSLRIPGALLSVTASSPRRAWAVGFRGTFDAGRALITEWDGTAWRRVPGASFPDAYSALLGVTAVSASDAWAVGEYGSGLPGGSNGKTLIEHWNGRRWRQVPSPDPSGGGVLNAVAAVSSRMAWAVGETRGGEPLITRWNGRRWAQVRAPRVTGVACCSFFLSGVTAASARSAWAVGGTGLSPLIFRWNGTSWRKVASPNPGQSTDLSGVAGAPGGRAWAVGSEAPRRGDITAVVLRWNGAAWRQTHTPGPPGRLLSGVTVSAAGVAQAVGCDPGRQGFRSYIVRWNGTAWKQIPSPDPAGGDVEPVSVTLGVPGSGWAVGAIISHAVPPEPTTLILHWNGRTWR